MKTFHIFFTVMIICMGCGHDAHDSEEGQQQAETNAVVLTPDQIKNAGIETDTVTRRTLSAELLVNGTIDVPPQNIVSISFPLGGYLKKTDLLPGVHVNKGDIIAVMEDQALIQLQQDYLMAVARLKFLEADYERQKLLQEGQANAKKIVQQTESEYQSQKILVKGFAEKLLLAGIDPKRLNDQTISRSVPVRSPINGFVSKVNVNIGKYVNPADVLFELVNPDDIHAALVIFEKDLGKVRTGQTVFVTFTGDSLSTYECDVLLITKNIDDNRSAIAHCHFKDQPKNLLPGMFVRARIQVSDIAGPSIASEAFVRYGNQQFLITQAADNRFELVEAQEGVRQGRYSQIIGQQTLEGRAVIVKNAYAVLSQMKNTGGGHDH